MRGGGRRDSVWLTRTLRGNRNDASLGAAAPRWNSAACVLGVCASALLREGHLGCEPVVSSPTRPIGRAGSREKERKRINPPPPNPPLPQHSHNHTRRRRPQPTARPTTHTPSSSSAPLRSSPSLDVAGIPRRRRAQVVRRRTGCSPSPEHPLLKLCRHFRRSVVRAVSGRAPTTLVPWFARFQAAHLPRRPPGRRGALPAAAKQRHRGLVRFASQLPSFPAGAGRSQPASARGPRAITRGPRGGRLPPPPASSLFHQTTVPGKFSVTRTYFVAGHIR